MDEGIAMMLAGHAKLAAAGLDELPLPKMLALADELQ
ncbi:MAG: hypothetical protein QOK33_901, partial [Mycobacterium sp.]|nr:hypothetical protein [Mycobacterium sp.]